MLFFAFVLPRLRTQTYLFVINWLRLAVDEGVAIDNSFGDESTSSNMAAV